MCLAVPGKLVEITDENGLRMGRVDYSGTIQNACLEYLPDAAVGQYVLVHAGFAISLLDEAEAEESLQVWREFAQFSTEQGD